METEARLDCKVLMPSIKVTECLVALNTENPYSNSVNFLNLVIRPFTTFDSLQDLQGSQKRAILV